MKIKRQTKILELINEHEIYTQDELAKYLIESGYDVTQATISRDIRELKLTKIAIGNEGKQKYIAIGGESSEFSSQYHIVLKGAFVVMHKAMNLIVIKTLTGMAMAVAAAIDAIGIDEIVGCIAGDDTIFCAVRSEEAANIAMEKIKKIINE